MNKLDLAINIAKSAGYYILQYWGNVDNVYEKENFQDLVTDYDKNAQNMIVSKIKKFFPEDGFIAEEGNLYEKSKNLWIIDPIDGTINYIHGLPNFGVSIAYFENEKPIFGVVFNPFTEELFVGIKNEGSFLNHSRLKITKNITLKESIGSTGFHKNFTGKFISNVENKVQRIRIIGSAALSACYVAANKFDFFVAKRANSWDIAAAYIIVKEAGGKIINFNGNTPKLFSKDSYIFSNPSISDEILELIKKQEGDL